jgi:hypothetical protein
MSRTLQFRRLGTATLANTTGANGELIINSTNKTLTVHDGTTPGGFALLNQATDFDIDQYARNTANTATNNITILQGVNTTQNTNITNATDLAQEAYDLAQEAYDYANTIISDTQIDQTARNIANSATVLAQTSYDNSNTKFSASGGQITGNVIIVGNLDVTNNTIVSNAMEANNVIIDGTLLTGLAARTSVVLPHLVAQFASNSATYIQVNSQNINPAGSADYVITADNGSDSDYFLDLGLKGSQSNDQLLTAYDGYLTVQGSTIGQAGGNLIIGTTSSFPGLETKFVAGGYANNNIVMKLGTYGANVVGNLTVTGTITSGGIVAVDQVARNAANAAAQTIPQNAQSTDYTLQLTDAGKHIYYTNNSAVSLYIPWTANTTYANGTTITIISNTSSNVTVTPNTGVSLYLAGNTTSISRNVTTYGMATLIMTAANTWYINGSGVA